MLTLTASLAAASLQRGDTAAHWLDVAQDIATRVPDEPTHNWQLFSAANVGMWRVTVGVERGETGGAVLDCAGRVRLDHWEPKSPRRASFFPDVGRGLAQEPKTQAEAVRWLRRAEDAAPQNIRNSAAARETVAYLLAAMFGETSAAGHATAWQTPAIPRKRRALRAGEQIGMLGLIRLADRIGRTAIAAWTLAERELGQQLYRAAFLVRSWARSLSACSNAGSMASRSCCVSPWDFATMRQRAAARATLARTSSASPASRRK